MGIFGKNKQSSGEISLSGFDLSKRFDLYLVGTQQNTDFVAVENVRILGLRQNSTSTQDDEDDYSSGDDFGTFLELEQVDGSTLCIDAMIIQIVAEAGTIVSLRHVTI